MGVVLVPGTWSWSKGLATKNEWYQDGSPFVRFMEEMGVPVLSKEDPFTWDTDLGGVPWKGHHDWEAGGEAFRRYLDPKVRWGVSLPPEERNVIAHSHGLQVVLYACARGLYINTLISVCSPVRADMRKWWERAKPFIGHWRHISDQRSDKWQRLGALFDGALGWSKKHPGADVNVYLPKIGHSGLVNSPKCFPLWKDVGFPDLVSPQCGRSS